MRNLTITEYIGISLCHLIPVEYFIGYIAKNYPDALPIKIDFVNYIYWIIVMLHGLYYFKSHPYAKTGKRALIFFSANEDKLNKLMLCVKDNKIIVQSDDSDSPYKVG